MTSSGLIMVNAACDFFLLIYVHCICALLENFMVRTNAHLRRMLMKERNMCYLSIIMCVFFYKTKLRKRTYETDYKA